MIGHIAPTILRIRSRFLFSVSVFHSPFPFAIFYLHSPSYHKPTPSTTSNWNTNHSFVLSNPLLSLLERCNSMSQLKQIQAEMTTSGLIVDGLASSRLVAFCAISSSGDLSFCERILKSLTNPKAFSWNVAIRGYAESETPIRAIALYKEMLVSGGSRPDNYTYPLLFKSCARLSFVLMGYQILGHVLKLGFSSDVFVINGMIHMLVSCDELGEARKVFDESPVKDLVTWNTLINGYVHHGMAKEALDLYEEMKTVGVQPDAVTMIGLVSSCAQLMDLKRGRQFHLYIQENKLSFNVPLCNSFMDMYVKCKDLEAARVLFDNMGKKTMVSWTTMVMGYAKCGLLDDARRIFNNMPEKDVVPWNAMIGAYSQDGRPKEALALFHEMQGSSVRPDEVTMVNCLSACSQIGALDVGISIHRYIQTEKLCLNVALGTALVDMYVKCANINNALQVFHEMPRKNCLTWTVIIGGLALHGNSQDAILYFSKMIKSGLVPDEITFLGLLSACCHGGLVDEGRAYFSEMVSKYNLTPKLKHYSCMVDLLGRAGLLEHAESLIKSMPMEPDAAVWSALFFACQMHGHVEMGKKAAEKLIGLDPTDSGTYVLLANMYREANMWEEARKVRTMMERRRIEKTPGQSSVEHCESSVT